MKENLLTALWYYLAVINVLLYILMGVDKFLALKQKRRISEKVLFLLALLGGAGGGTLGMLCFNHKTRHRAFAIVFPILMVLDVAAVVYMIAK